MARENENQQNNQSTEQTQDNQQDLNPDLQVDINNQPATPQPRVYTADEVATIHNLYGQTLRENEQRYQALQQQINSQQQPVNNQQQRSPESDDFLSNGRNIVAEEIDKRLAPFSQFIQQQQSQTLYSQLKDTFKRHPTYSSFFAIPQAEALLDQQALQVPAANMNTQTMTLLIAQIYGYMQLNGMVPQQQIQAPINNQQQQFNQPQINQQQPVNNNQQNLPPHLRPSAPTMMNNNQQNMTPKGNPRRPLTELERRVSREQGFKSDDEYIDWLNESTNNVYKSDIGRQQ